MMEAGALLGRAGARAPGAGRRFERTALLTAGGWTALVVAVLALTPSGGRSSDSLAVVASMVPLAVALVFLVAATAGRTRRERLFLGSFSAFVSLTLVGDVVSVATGSQHAVGARLSVADAIHVAAYVALLPGIVGGLRPLGRLRRSVVGADAAIATAGLAFVGYVLLLAPALRDPTAGKLVAVSYPLCDLAALAAFVPIVLGFRSAPAGAGFLLGSFGAAIVGDSAYAYFTLHGGSVFDTWFVLGFQLQFVLLALGGRYALGRPAASASVHERGHDAGLSIVLAVVATALGVLVRVGLAGEATRTERGGFAALMVLLVGRMLLGDRDLRRAERAERRRGEELERVVDARTAELRRSREASIRRLAEVIGMRDEETGGHIERIALYAALLGEQGGLDRGDIELLRVTSPLHDIGKIAVPDAILRKPGPLTPDERAVIEQHTIHGHRLLSGSGQRVLDFAAELALTHHERWDGNGYPHGLAGEEIPVGGRILAVCDVFDALTSDRVYRPAVPLSDVLAIMRAGRGTQFDPAVLDTFLASLPAVLRLRETALDDPVDAA